jgi:hypothetical protein
MAAYGEGEQVGQAASLQQALAMVAAGLARRGCRSRWPSATLGCIGNQALGWRCAAGSACA